MAASESLSGRSLRHHRLLEKIGAGGMGEVYRAHDGRLGRDVAVKVLPASSLLDPHARARLLREARTASQLNHPNICTIHEVDEADGRGYIVMELVAGQTLSARIAPGPLPTAQVVAVGLQLADALSHAHERGIVHRDFKSGNIVVTPEGRAKVLDFGLARRTAVEEDGEATRTMVTEHQVAGTVAYMAPEQLRGQPADARSDIWSLGVVLHEMASGRMPFGGTTGFELSSAILNDPPADLPATVPPELRATIRRCLEKSAERRFQRVQDVRSALDALHRGAPVAVPWRYRRNSRAWLPVAGGLAITLSALAAFDAGGVRSRLLRAPEAPRIESLAVLPLENLSGDPDQEYFADAMTEELIAQVAGLGGVTRVIARGSVMRYKGSRRPLPEIGRELNVQALVTGTVLRSGERVRITAELVNPETEAQIWTRRYERDVRDILALQNDLTRAIAEEIRATLAPGAEARATARPVHPEAFEAYLRGRYRARMTNADAHDIAEQYLRFSIEKDPGFAAAHAALGMIWVARAHMGVRPPRDVIEPAMESISRALQLNENDAEAHHSLGSLNVYVRWDWEAAERHFLRAIELNPGQAESQLWYSDVLAVKGQRSAALARIRRSLDLDPLNMFIQTSAAGRLLRLGYRDDALVLLSRSVAREPNISLTRRYLWYVFHLDGREAQAVGELAAFFRLNSRSEVADAIERTHGEQGYPAALRAGADMLAERRRASYVQPTQIAILYAAAGNRDLAVEWLETAYDERDTWLGFLRDEPMLQNLRGEPRVHELLRRMNIPT